MGRAQGLARDRTHYPVVEKVGEGTLQREIITLLLPLVRRYLALRGERAFVGADQFIYWVQGDPKIRVSPDLYVLPGVAPDTGFGCWKTWETGVVPSFALEVVSKNVRKDYKYSPERFERLGVRELVIFDPEPGTPRRARVRWQHFRRGARGAWRSVPTLGDRVESAVLGCWLREAGEGTALRLRLGTGPRGEALVPTEAEAAQAEVARLRAELARLRG